MTSISFYARGDSSSANNASLNAEGTSKTPTTLITFESGVDGDIVLDTNNGDFDPDTTVVVDGVSYNFTVEFSGNLPQSNKLADVNGSDLRGEQVVVITLETGQRYFFLPDADPDLATMDLFPNGAHNVANPDTTTPITVCFCTGTRLLGANGPVAVEDIAVGDLLRTAEGAILPVRWVGATPIGLGMQIVHPSLRPVCIPAHALGPNRPYRDLWVSPQHRVHVSGWQVELMTGLHEALIPAVQLVGRNGIARRLFPGPFSYHHILFDQHEMVMSEGLATESFDPGETAEFTLPDDQAQSLRHALSAQNDLHAHLPTLRQAEVLACGY